MILFTFEYPPVDGGISRLCAGIAAWYAARGRPLTVLAQEVRGEGSVVPPATINRVVDARPNREWDALRWLRRNRYAGPTVCGIWYPEGLLAMISGVRQRVILAHGSELFPPAANWRKRIWASLQRRVLEGADLVVANSEYTRGLVRESAPLAKVVTIPLAVDAARFSPAGRTVARERFGVGGNRVISTVSRVDAYKGHETVLRALAQLPAAVREDFTYLVAGKGAYLHRLQTIAQDLGVAHVVRWLGFVSETDLPNLYRASDLFLLCTREDAANRDVEGFGLVFLEAQACGCPVLGARAGGIPDAVKVGGGGMLVEQDDFAAVASVLQSLHSDPERFAEMGAVARARVVGECTWEHYMTRFTKALRDAGIANGN